MIKLLHSVWAYAELWKGMKHLDCYLFWLLKIFRFQNLYHQVIHSCMCTRQYHCCFCECSGVESRRRMFEYVLESNDINLKILLRGPVWFRIVIVITIKNWQNLILLERMTNFYRASLGRTNEIYWAFAAIMSSFTILFIAVVGVVLTLRFLGLLQVGYQ